VCRDGEITLPFHWTRLLAAPDVLQTGGHGLRMKRSIPLACGVHGSPVSGSVISKFCFTIDEREGRNALSFT
jgi:hypothetical protein